MSDSIDDRFHRVVQIIGRIDMLIKDPEFELGGDTYVDPKWLEWSETPWKRDAGQCHEDGDEPWVEADKHLTTVCDECIASWMQDWWLRIYDTDGKLILDTQALTIERSGDV